MTTDNYFYFCEISQSVERKANKSSGNSKQNQERSAITTEKNERKSSFLQTVQIWRYYFSLTAYQGEVNKHVLILRTMHKDTTIANNAKKTPETVSSYNEAK